MFPYTLYNQCFPNYFCQQNLPEISNMIRHHGPCPQHCFAIQYLMHVRQCHRQTPEKTGQSLDIARIFERFANDLHLGGGKGKRWYSQNGTGCYDLMGSDGCRWEIFLRRLLLALRRSNGHFIRWIHCEQIRILYTRRNVVEFCGFLAFQFRTKKRKLNENCYFKTLSWNFERFCAKCFVLNTVSQITSFDFFR